jgi:GTPase SAR1 family protein
MPGPGNVLQERLRNLEAHLEKENPVLLHVVQGFRTLDRVAYRVGLLDTDRSYAMQIPWWPLISILGTFSAGKSTFINHYLGQQLQRTGNQAVDDKFSVICYSGGSEGQTLPGVALDNDPRFPFYQFSNEIESVANGEGKRIDAYLQLKTSCSEQLRGKTLIDSPGFDADSQRTSTLRITDHIIDISDLVMVFFDARHPEPGAMQDTLRHLVEETIGRADSEKFLYILNQIDTTAREDNPEEVVAAWQRAMGEKGLTAGRFYTIYSPTAAVPIDDERLRHRFESKRDEDLADIRERMEQVEVQRAYRIVNALEKSAREIQERTVPLLSDALQRWRTRTLWGDGVLFGLAGIGALTWSVRSDHWDGLRFTPPWWDSLTADTVTVYFLLLTLAILGVSLHYGVRNLAARSVARQLRGHASEGLMRGDVRRAFLRNTRPWRSIFSKQPAGWGRSARKQIEKIMLDTDRYVQELNDSYADPSGHSDAAAQQSVAPVQSQPLATTVSANGVTEQDTVAANR